MTEPKEKPIKPPPIFVDKVENIQPLISLLNNYAQNNYELKVLNNEQVKIQPKTPDAYREIVKQLEIKNTEFYTYKPKQERSFKVVLKNIHPSTDLNDIKLELAELGHDCVNIWNIKQRKTKKPLPIFIVELKPHENNKNVYHIKYLLKCKIAFEPPHPKREIPQCAKCQQYGHTKAYCRRNPKCIKCAGDHLSVDCPRKTRSNDVKCVLCEGNHPANYKGCQVYRELQKVKLPGKAEINRNQRKYSRPNPTQQTENTNGPSKNQSQKTYRDVLTKEANKTDKQNYSSQGDTGNDNNSNADLINMLKQMIQQLTNMTNLLITLTTKLTNSTP